MSRRVTGLKKLLQGVGLVVAAAAIAVGINLAYPLPGSMEFSADLERVHRCALGRLNDARERALPPLSKNEDWRARRQHRHWSKEIAKEFGADARLIVFGTDLGRHGQPHMIALSSNAGADTIRVRDVHDPRAQMTGKSGLRRWDWAIIAWCGYVESRFMNASS